MRHREHRDFDRTILAEAFSQLIRDAFQRLLSRVRRSGEKKSHHETDLFHGSNVQQTPGCRQGIN
jgi:hypothetical protein